MIERGRFAICSFTILVTACGAVKPYSVVVPAPDATLLPPSADLAEYTKNGGLTQQVERTTLYCGKVRHAIASELDQRTRRNSLTKRVLLFIGSAAALATTVYSGLENNPSKNVLVPLSAVTGTALLTSLPSLTEDERAGALKDKLAAVNAKESAVVENLNVMEKGLLDLGILRLQLADTTLPKSQLALLNKDIIAKYEDLAPVEDHLRTSLASLAGECN